jgi:hypothetical protein
MLYYVFGQVFVFDGVVVFFAFQNLTEITITDRDRESFIFWLKVES